MTEEQKLALQRFLGSVKIAIMATSVGSVSDDQLSLVYNNFKALCEIATASEEEPSDNDNQD